MTLIILLLLTIYSIIAGVTFTGAVWVIVRLNDTIDGYVIPVIAAFLWPIALPAALGGYLMSMYIDEYVKDEDESGEDR